MTEKESRPFQATEVVPNLYWVGALDWDLRVFDIIMSTPYGTTYNSYLLKHEKANILFETVKEEFHEECLERIESVLGKDGKIDYIVLNHTEPDHSGSLPYILAKYPMATVVCTNVAYINIKAIGHIAASQKVNVINAKNNSLEIASDLHLNFLIQPMLHWPDTMMTVIPEMKVLITCDVFGGHCADRRLFNDAMGDRIAEIEDAYKHYFDCIFGPFKPFVLKGIDLIENKMGFPVSELKAICCSHGPILRTNIQYFIDRYRNWSQPPVLKDKVVIVYGSAYGYTKKMAETIAEGIKSLGVEVSIHDIVQSSVDAVVKDFDDAKGMLLGTPTLVGDAIPPMYNILAGINPIVYKGRFIQTFGSFGWSGEGTKNLEVRIKQCGAVMPVPALAIKFKPTEENLKQ